MEIIEKNIDNIRPYENNPRINDNAVDAVAESIRLYGWKQPIVIDSDGVIVVGHTRYKAAKQLGLKTVPCIIADDLTPEKVKEYRLVDNKTNEYAEWDFTALEQELNDLNSSEFEEIFKFDGEAKIDFYDDKCGVKEIDTEEFDDEQFRYKCPRCGFRYN